MIIVQHIETRWTKASRGMPGAALRNSVPRALPLEPAPELVSGVYVHRVSADERDRFALRQVTATIEPGQQFTPYWSLRFFSAGDSVRVEFRYLLDEHGLPRRERPQHVLFTLAPGQSGALHINGRFNYRTVQYYKQHFVNVANAQAVRRSLFTDGPADYFIDMTADLF